MTGARSTMPDPLPDVVAFLDRHTPSFDRDPDWNGVVRRASRRRLTRGLVVAIGCVAAASLATMLTVLLVATPASDDRGPAADIPTVSTPPQGVVAGPAVLQAGRMSIAIAHGWTGQSRVGGITENGNQGGLAIVRAATITLPAKDDDLASVAQVALGPDDILVNLLDYGPGSGTGLSVRSGPPQITRESTGGYSGGVALGFARTNFVVDDHNIVIDVGFGRADPTGDQLRRANAVLATFVPVP